MFKTRTAQHWILKTETRVEGWPRVKGNEESLPGHLSQLELEKGDVSADPRKGEGSW